MRQAKSGSVTFPRGKQFHTLGHTRLLYIWIYIRSRALATNDMRLCHWENSSRDEVAVSMILQGYMCMLRDLGREVWPVEEFWRRLSAMMMACFDSSATWLMSEDQTAYFRNGQFSSAVTVLCCTSKSTTCSSKESGCKFKVWLMPLQAVRRQSCLVWQSIICQCLSLLWCKFQAFFERPWASTDVWVALYFDYKLRDDKT